MKDSKNTQNTDNQDSVNPVKKPRFQIQFDIDYDGTAVLQSGHSETVPDMNLTVRQLLTNHSRGLSNDRHTKDPIYFDVKIPKITDLTDVEKYREQLQQKMTDVDNFIKEEQHAKQLDLEEEIEKQRLKDEQIPSKKDIEQS